MSKYFLMFSGIPSLGFLQIYINTSWLLSFLMGFIHSTRLMVGAEWLLLPSFFFKYFKGSIIAPSKSIPLLALRHKIIYSILHLRLYETHYYKYLKCWLKPLSQWIMDITTMLFLHFTCTLFFVKTCLYTALDVSP